MHSKNIIKSIIIIIYELHVLWRRVAKPILVCIQKKLVSVDVVLTTTNCANLGGTLVCLSFDYHRFMPNLSKKRKKKRLPLARAVTRVVCKERTNELECICLSSKLVVEYRTSIGGLVCSVRNKKLI